MEDDQFTPSSESSVTASVTVAEKSVFFVWQPIAMSSGSEVNETTDLSSSANTALVGSPVQTKYAPSKPSLRARMVRAVGQTTPFVATFAPHVSPSMETSVSASVAEIETSASWITPRKRFKSRAWLTALSSAVSTLL